MMAELPDEAAALRFENTVHARIAAVSFELATAD